MIQMAALLLTLSDMGLTLLKKRSKISSMQGLKLHLISLRRSRECLGTKGKAMRQRR
jgi:hypothetical protein